ncbi:MAG: UDP-N-acetylglucosamine 2-epimerase (non-hydrolyzing) [Anaerohalosphaeraceae bacterium]
MSRKKRIVISIGTRPEAIKMAPVYLAIKASQDLEAVLLSTAQHRQLLDQVLSVFGIQPDVDLNLMSPNQRLSEISAKILTETQKVLSSMKPDAILVHGDTATCLFSALAAFYERIPIGHVEAGLRTYDFDAPWPEEMNRRLVDPICRWCFAPTERARQNLLREGISEHHIYITGNTAVDGLFLGLEKLGRRPPSIPGLEPGCLDGKRLILVTGHRRESFGVQMEQICRAFRRIMDDNSDCVLVYPVHLNPHVQRPVRQLLGEHPRILLIEPVEYLPFIDLMRRSTLIITDSGGIQEEAPSLQKPVLITRRTTERPEAVENGLARIVGTETENIVNQANRLLTDAREYQKMIGIQNPFGDGRASERIVSILRATL